MFKMFHPTFFVVPIAWLTVAFLAILSAATPLLSGLGITPLTSWAVLGVQGVLTAFFVTPLWRLLWRLLPQLNRWVFPDLNGEWDVDVYSNWPRIDAGLKAANGETTLLDLRSADEDKLPALGEYKMRAEITQSWAAIRMNLWNPEGLGPIKGSKTLMVEPLRGDDGRHGLVYVFEQENETASIHDERKFFGAVRVELERGDLNTLCGQMWSDRMWQRGMNTAARLRFRRREEAD